MTRAVAGIDFSLTSAGVVLSYGAMHRVRSTGTANDTLIQRQARLVDLTRRIVELVTFADLVVIEGPSYGSKGGHNHDRSAGWWFVVNALITADIPVVEVPPSCLKRYATGKGSASKDLVLAETVRRYTGWDVNGNDTADALNLAAMGSDALGFPLVQMPATHRAALNSITWPTLPVVAA